LRQNNEKEESFEQHHVIATTGLIASFVIIIGYLYTYFSSAGKNNTQR